MGPLAATLLVLLAQTGTLRATPAHAVGGSAEKVKLELAVEGATEAAFDVFGVGAVGPVGQSSPGHFLAEWTPPKEAYPQVAIIRAQAMVKGAPVNVWSAVPVFGVSTLKLTTKPLSKVDVQVGSEHFQSDVSSDSKGRVEVEVHVPPGVDTGRARSVDRLGNTKEKPVPLEPPPFVRVRVAPTSGALAASWADRAPLELEVFAVKRDGSPATAAPALSVQAGGGTIDPLSLVRPGLWSTRFRAPPRTGDGKATLKAVTRDAAPVEPLLLRIALLPGPATSLSLRASSKVVRPDDPPVMIEWSAKDAHDNPVGRTPNIVADFGQLSPVVAQPGEVAQTTAAFSVPPAFAGHTAATLTATLDGAQTRLTLPLEHGVPTRGTFTLAQNRLRAGAEPILAQVTLEDSRGNPVSAAQLRPSADRGQFTVLKDAGGGRYELAYGADVDVSGGPVTLTVAVPAGNLTLSQRVDVIGAPRPGNISVGALVGLRSNFAASKGAHALLDVGVVPAHLPLELILDLGFAKLSPVSQQLVNATSSAQLSTASVAAGARYSIPLTPLAALHFSLTAGAQQVRPTVSIPDVSVKSTTRWTPIARAGIGASWKLGPGRVVLELDYGYERVRLGPTAAEPAMPLIEGNLGGALVSAGYLLQLR